MSCFGNLSKLRETATSKVDVAGLREYKYAELLDKKELGKGAFGAVFTAKLFTASKREAIVVKKSLSVDLLAKKSLVKEARLLKSLCHTSVVMFQNSRDLLRCISTANGVCIFRLSPNWTK